MEQNLETRTLTFVEMAAVQGAIKERNRAHERVTRILAALGLADGRNWAFDEESLTATAPALQLPTRAQRRQEKRNERGIPTQRRRLPAGAGVSDGHAGNPNADAIGSDPHADVSDDRAPTPGPDAGDAAAVLRDGENPLTKFGQGPALLHQTAGKNGR